MIVYRTAFKLAGRWVVTGLKFVREEDAEARAAACRKRSPPREVIVVCIDDDRITEVIDG